MPFPFIDSKWDFRPDERSVSEYLFQEKTKKDYIVNGPKPERDYLFNLFFAKKDYEEIHKKVFYSAFIGAKLATVLSLSAIASAKTRSPKVALKLAGKMFFYFGGGVTAYGALSSSIANARGKKDDCWNHFAAGGVLGMIPAYVTRSSGYGFAWGVAFACLGAYVKYIYQTEQTFLLKRGSIAFRDGNRSTNFRFYSPYWQTYPRENRIKP